ncbi:hypothetical protein [Mucilaginibacter sp. L196]|uniref:hypothetical protein n=1 Tax=Mucilaginibacter sp. L196 TaxID=1641870 RepID=UPI00131E22AC|nr:hypothetical protein [Mucilaginibacter sp. L196]
MILIEKNSQQAGKPKPTRLQLPGAATGFPAVVLFSVRDWKWHPAEQIQRKARRAESGKRPPK